MNGTASVTKGWNDVTSGIALSRKRILAAAAFVAVCALQAFSNSSSRIADRRGDGLSPEVSSVLLDEVSSVVAWSVCLALIWQLVKHLRPPRFTVPVALLVCL